MDINKIKELVQLVDESGIAELEVKYAGVQIRISKNSGQAVQFAQPQAIAAAMPAVPLQAAEKPADENKYFEIKAPIVGTFYRKPSPDSDPYIKVGQRISKGQVVCLIEAMKIFNEIKSDVSGKIVEITLEDGHPVEYGQVLYIVEPE